MNALVRVIYYRIGKLVNKAYDAQKGRV